jgi:uncharacterized DUF497 family protein
MYFTYNEQKNKILKDTRGISFDEIIALIEAGKIVDVITHPKQKDYPNQKIYLIDIDNYLWLVPFIQNDSEIFLKTAFPSRKLNKEYKKPGGLIC